MNIIYFTMKKLNENRAFLAMLGFLFVFSCSKDKKEGNGNGNGNGDVTKYTLSITAPIDGKLVSKPGNIDCGGEGTVCKAEFDKGTEVTLIATADKGYAPAAWQGDCDKTKAGEACKLAMDANKTAGLMFGIDTDGDGIPNETDPDDDGDGTNDDTDVDDDNDGLIEVHNLDMFDHIRHSLAGTSYKTSTGATDNRTGAPTKATADCTTVVSGTSAYLCGYELTKDLDFSDEKSYASGSVNASWRPNDQADAGGSAASPDAALNPGFVGATNFAGLFEGNGYKISNLYSRNTASSEARIGLFASITSLASIRNLGVVNAHLYGNSALDYIGALVGFSQGKISASSATGGTFNGGAGEDYIGGLVGWVDVSSDTRVIASYATGGTLNGGAGTDGLGGLIGVNLASVVASYATGAVNGDGGDDYVGGLIGVNSILEGVGSVLASYATGDVDGGGGSDEVGILVGRNDVPRFRSRGTVTASYAFGSKSGGTGSDHHDGTAKPDGVTSANGLTADNVDAKWNDAAEKTLNTWDFGTASQAPALRYADYDGDGADFSCDMFPKKIPGTKIPLICGKSLLPGQER